MRDFFFRCAALHLNASHEGRKKTSFLVFFKYTFNCRRFCIFLSLWKMQSLFSTSTHDLDAGNGSCRLILYNLYFSISWALLCVALIIFFSHLIIIGLTCVEERFLPFGSCTHSHKTSVDNGNWFCIMKIISKYNRL